jgi:hypothetical protein
MLTLAGLKRAEKFVEKQQALGNDVRWDGWDIVFFREAPQAVYSKEGVVRKGTFGFDNRVKVSDSGTWEVDYRNVRRAKRAGS